MVTKDWKDARPLHRADVRRGVRRGLADPGLQVFPAPRPAAAHPGPVRRRADAPERRAAGAAARDRWARCSAPAGRAASSSTSTPISRSTCPRRGWSSTASGSPTWGWTWPASAGSWARCSAARYVNRFNYFDRSYKVIPQIGDAERATDRAAARSQDQDAQRASWCRSRPSRASRPSTAPRTLNRFQQRNAVRIFGGVKPGVTKEEGLRVLETAATAIGRPGDRRSTTPASPGRSVARGARSP